jgi:uncharacterized lipoprotein YddW (UPF0748 family)
MICVRKGTLIIFLILITLLIFNNLNSLLANPYRDKNGKYRAIWVDAYNPGFLSRSEAKKLIDDCRRYNINTVIVEIRKLGDAYYKSNYEPRATNIQDSPDYDPLQYIIDWAHDTSNGKKYIEVHAWFVIYKVMKINNKDAELKMFSTSFNTSIRSNPNHILAKHPEWCTISYDGKKDLDDNVFLDPGIPAVTDYTINVIMDVVRNYNIDGVNFDYIRYPGKDWGYDQMSLKRFQRLYNRTGIPEPGDRLWSQFRRNQVTAFLKKSYITILSEKPQIIVSTDTTSWGSIKGNNFYATSPYMEVFQDWQGWMREHILDINTRMGYKRQSVLSQKVDYGKWTRFALDNQYGRIALIGQGAYLNSIRDSVKQVDTALDMGAKGFIIYSYNGTNNEKRPQEDFFRELKKWICPEWIYPPILEWKNKPAESIIKGMVKSSRFGIIDSAKIVLTSKYSETTFTDGTGFYAFTRVTPGNYSIMAKISNNEVKVIKNIEMRAGEIREINFEF